MAAPLAPDDPGEVGPYRMEGLLGEGGMGKVFLGRTPGGRPVAVKVVHATLARDTEFRRRFANEVAAARTIGGFYTAQVVDADTDADPPWLATAYVAGPSLHRAVTTTGPLPQGSVAVLGAGLAEGLAAVHSQGLVHRDLKPGNVVLGADGPRLIDFGLARALDGTALTRTGTALGTLAFMSPEQAAAEEAVSFPSDVFSLGGALAFAATGHGPFDATGAPAVLYRLVHGEPDLSGVPEDLAEVVAACLAKDPDQRPSPEEVLGELSPLAEDVGDAWLPPDLTEEIHRQRTRVMSRTGSTKPMDDDTGPTGERRARRTKRQATTEDEDSEPPPRQQQRGGARDGPGRLRVGNLASYSLDVIVDGRAVGTVAESATAEFPLDAGEYAVQAKHTKGGKEPGPVRHLRIEPGATTGIAFHGFGIPKPTDSVDYDNDTRGASEWPGWVCAAAGLIAGLVFMMPRLSSELSYGSLSFEEVMASLTVIIGGAFVGGILGNVGYPVIALLTQPKSPNHCELSVRADGFTVTHDQTELSLSWDDVERIAVVGEEKQTRLVVWPRKPHTTRFGVRVSGETEVCELAKMGGTFSVHDALWLFAGERFQG